MRLGAPIFDKFTTPQEWAAAHQRLGYSAAYCPINDDQPDGVVRAYRDAARQANLVIAEVGAWSNSISTDDTQRRQAIENCQRKLHLAERIGARCCANIAGSRGARWDGPHPSHYTRDVFDLIVQTVRQIIDAVQPQQTFYTLETMPWVPPDSADSYLDLVRAIDRKQFAVHLDPVNIITSPRLYYHTADLLRDCFQKLGPHIRSCHAKDILLADNLTVHLSETGPGQGNLDYATYLRELSQLDPDTPLMLEHLKTAEEYTQAASHVRRVAAHEGLRFL